MNSKVVIWRTLDSGDGVSVWYVEPVTQDIWFDCNCGEVRKSQTKRALPNVSSFLAGALLFWYRRISTRWTFPVFLRVSFVNSISADARLRFRLTSCDPIRYLRSQGALSSGDDGHQPPPCTGPVAATSWSFFIPFCPLLQVRPRLSRTFNSEV